MINCSSIRTINTIHIVSDLICAYDFIEEKFRYFAYFVFVGVLSLACVHTLLSEGINTSHVTFFSVKYYLSNHIAFRELEIYIAKAIYCKY